MLVANIIIALIVGLVFTLVFFLVISIARGLSLKRRSVGEGLVPSGEVVTSAAITINRVAFCFVIVAFPLAFFTGYMISLRG